MNFLYYCYGPLRGIPQFFLKFLNRLYCMYVMFQYKHTYAEVENEQFRGLLFERVSDTAILYCHGGFLDIGRPANDMRFINDVVSKTNCTLLALEFQEPSVRKAAKEMMKAYKWLKSKGTKRVVCMGTGGGGYLVLHFVHRHAEKLPCIFISPVFEPSSVPNHPQRYDYLRYTSVQNAMQPLLRTKPLDVAKTLDKLGRGLLIYGERELFSQQIKKRKKHMDKVVTSPFGTHAYPVYGGLGAHMAVDNICAFIKKQETST